MTEIRGTIRSKRLALRFNGNRQRVKLKTEFDDGEATLANISTSGAALENPTLSLSVDEKILLIFELFEAEKPVEIQAIVVRTEEEKYSVQFQGVGIETKTDLLKFFAHKARVKND